MSLLRPKGFLGFITPNTFIVIENGKKLRELLFNQNCIISLLETYNVFPDAVVEPITTILRKERVDRASTFETLFASKK